MNNTDQFEIVLKAEGQGPPVEIRLRRWLKAALRGYGLRCLTIRVVEDHTMPDAARGKAQGAIGRDEPHD